ncbi:MAG TPA: YciI family protein [Steroidobacteraceae bacterium]
MQYALLIYESPEDFANRQNERDYEPYIGAWRAYYQSMVAAGVYAGGQPLDLPETGTTVAHPNGKRQIHDGPYANTKEQLAGIMLMELPSLDAALDWATRCPAAVRGAVEVRPVAPRIHLLVTGARADN